MQGNINRRPLKRMKKIEKLPPPDQRAMKARLQPMARGSYERMDPIDSSSAGRRRRMVGPAAQMSYERSERRERQQKIDMIAGQRSATAEAQEKARQKIVRRKRGETGSSAGTYGGSRSSLMRSFLGR